MNRRDFLQNLGAEIISQSSLHERIHTQQAFIQRPTPAPSLPAVEWRMATSWSKTLDVLLSGPRLLAERVAALTEGRFKIEVFPAGELMPALGVFEGVQKGEVQCAHTASFYFIGKNDVFGISTGLPFGLTSQQQMVWLYDGGGMESIQKAYADFGMISFPAGGTGTQMGGWLRREVQTLKDLKGFKFRIPGLGGKVMQRLDVETVVIPPDDIFRALNAGEIDAAEWIGPYDDEKLGLHKAAPYYYYPGWWEPGSTFDFIVNKQAWDSLPQLYRAILQSVTRQVSVEQVALYDVRNQEALVRLVASGTQLRPYSEEIMIAAKEAAFELYEETANTNALFKEIFTSWKEFRKKIYQWSRFNELSFALFATENL